MFIIWTCVWLLLLCSSGHVRVYAPRESKLCLPISAGLKAASIMHEDQYAVALWVRLCAHIKYSRQLPCRLKRSMPLDLSGLRGKQTAIVTCYCLGEAKKKTKLVELCLGYLWHLQLHDTIDGDFRRSILQISVLKGRFTKNPFMIYVLQALPPTDSPLKAFAAEFIPYSSITSLFIYVLCCVFQLSCATSTHFDNSVTKGVSEV